MAAGACASCSSVVMSNGSLRSARCVIATNQSQHSPAPIRRLSARRITALPPLGARVERNRGIAALGREERIAGALPPAGIVHQHGIAELGLCACVVAREPLVDQP